MLPGAQLSLYACLFHRLVSGNSIEEKLLKNGTKDLIREVAAQGNDYSMAFLTQVPITGVQSSWSLHGEGGGGQCSLTRVDEELPGSFPGDAV